MEIYLSIMDQVQIVTPSTYKTNFFVSADVFPNRYYAQ